MIGIFVGVLPHLFPDDALAGVLLCDYERRCWEHARGVPEMVSTLAALRSRGLCLAIVTNGETEFQKRHVKALGLTDWLDAVLISEAEGLRKSDQAIFRRAADWLGVEPSRCLFVGDNLTADIPGTRNAGMHTAWFKRDAVWPDCIPPLPGFAIDCLKEVLALVGIDMPVLPKAVGRR